MDMLIPEAKIEELRYALSSSRFAKEKLLFTPDDWQAKLLESEKRGILVNCSRQAGKSETVSVKSLHKALFFENSVILIISRSERQSKLVLKKIKKHYKRLKTKQSKTNFRIPTLIADNKTELEFDNDSIIVCLPSIEDTIRGYSSVNLMIIDEASKVADEVYKSVRPMLAVSGGQLIILSTPFGKRGFFYEEWEHGEDWERFTVTAYDCPRITKEFLESERKHLGDWWFRQEYMCEFVETTDSVFSYEMIMQSLSNEVQPLMIDDDEMNNDDVILFEVD
jgi:hypothetical protein